jgi:hypothetical protein
MIAPPPSTPAKMYFSIFWYFSSLCKNIVMGAASFLFLQLLQHHAVWLEDLLELLNNFNSAIR